jgi:hypothetical protein
MVPTPLFTMLKSACAGGHVTTVLTVLLWLFPGLLSVVLALTDAWFCTVALHVKVEGTVNAIVTVALCPLLKLKLLQTILLPFCTQFPELAPALKVNPAGMGSWITTFVAVSGPPFVAVRV